MSDAGQVKLTERLIAERDEARRQLADAAVVLADIGRERDRLRDAIAHVVNDSPGTRVKAFLRAALAESEETT